MDVTHLPLDERERLCSQWWEYYEDIIKSNVWDEGNDIFISKEDLLNPDYRLIEHDEKDLDKLRAEVDCIGRRVIIDNREAEIIGFDASYLDFYYILKFLDNEKITSYPFCGKLQFIDEK